LLYNLKKKSVGIIIDKKYYLTLPLLVAAQGVRLLENASIFFVRCIADAAFLVLREQRVKGDPTGA
jgi:hypothetical protein